MNVRARFAIRRDNENIVLLDEKVNEWRCWSLDNYEEFVCGRNQILLVAVCGYDDTVKGVLAYISPAEQDDPGQIEVVRLVADCTEAYDCLLARIFGRLGGRITSIQFAVSEFDSAMHQRLRLSQFQAVGVIRGQEEGCEDSYLFEYQVPMCEIVGV